MYYYNFLEVDVANPNMKKWRQGRGIKFSANFFESEFNRPDNLKHQVTPDKAAETKWFRSTYVEAVNLKFLKQMS
jgi:hypothetical protein